MFLTQTKRLSNRIFWHFWEVDSEHNPWQHCAESRKQCQKWYIQIPVEQRTAGDVVIFAGPCLLLLADIFWAGAKRHLQTTRSDVCLFPPVGIPCLPFYCCILGRVLYAPRGFAKHSISRMNYIQFNRTCYLWLRQCLQADSQEKEAHKMATADI